MKQLLLLRHAEAEPAPPGSKDSDRPLTENGRREALEAAAAIAGARISIDAMLVSPAFRTRETATLVTRRLGIDVMTLFPEELYLAAPETMLQLLQERCDLGAAVLLIAHNPGISELTYQLSGGKQVIALRTGGLCHLSLDCERWDQLPAAGASAYTILR